ncbi:hypothetical protein GT030_20875 [Streptomyces sp. SID1328]|uniref:hypothetical protein n=1 Tax=Streptomyces sp. SID1328 TaxID=2690250 RepID=UPI001368A9F1|nr:hypothetical protein [Streptomyces sp. SID1328]MYV41251.1 hypothetical protein [Streptomyces sp. SID1328]
MRVGRTRLPAHAELDRLGFVALGFSLTAHLSLHPDASGLQIRITWLQGGKDTSYDFALGVRP